MSLEASFAPLSLTGVDADCEGSANFGSESPAAPLSVGFFASRVFSVVELSNSTGADTDTRLDAASCSASKCSVGMCSGGGASLSLSLPGADDAGPAVVSGGRDGPRRASSGLFTSADLS